MSRPRAASRQAFPVFLPITTRWLDNDAYGHLNNTVYYSFFDTAVNRYLVEAGALDIERSPVIGLVVETQCNYFAPLGFPQPVEVGLRVGHVGSSSVRYDLGVFASGAQAAAAQGHFVHVYVDRTSRRPAPLPAGLLQALVPLRVAG
jgi:acyl-CoA thioester hydrolase